MNMTESRYECFESTKAKQILEELKEYEFLFCSISLAPSVGTFTSLQRTISHKYFRKASVLSFFDISSATLTGNKNEAIGAAVSCLKKCAKSIMDHLYLLWNIHR